MVSEKTVVIRVNGTTVSRTQCLAKDLEQMTLGFLVCEQVIRVPAEVTKLETDTAAGSVNVTAAVPPERLRRRSGQIRLAAGGSSTAVIDLVEEKLKHLKNISSSFSVSVDRLLSVGNEFNDFVGLYKDTRFVHSAALSDGEHIIHHCEDVGRHNAVDKVIGYGLQHKADFSRLLLLCSGRFSVEMVCKAAQVGVPVFASPAAASIEAMEMAERTGMTLCGRIEKQGAVIYSCPKRITGYDKKAVRMSRTTCNGECTSPSCK